MSVYGYSWGARSSKEAAKFMALKFCNDSGWRNKRNMERTGKCRLLAVNGKLLVKDPWIGFAWHEPAAGEDILS